MLIFDAETHTYKHPHTDQEYISTTTLINKFKAPFDIKGAAERIAKRDGKDPEQIQAQWDKINNDAMNYGSMFHAVIERYNKDKTYDKEHSNIIDSYLAIDEILEGDELLSEQQLFLNENRIAGTADIIRLNKKGRFDIFDIKTNRRFRFSSAYGEKMFSPLAHLDACEYNTYCLQLSMYAYMYHIMTGRELQQLGILHYNKENNKFSYYPVPYMKTDIQNIIRFYEKSNMG